MNDEPAKTAEASRSSLSMLTRPDHANVYGNVHGGVLLRLADEVASLVAMRHAHGREVATAVLDSFTFLGPVRVGEKLDGHAVIAHVGRTSMDIEFELFAEPLTTFEIRLVAKGHGLWVALGRDGKPTPVPPLKVETEDDRRRAETALARQAERLARRGSGGGGSS